MPEPRASAAPEVLLAHTVHTVDERQPHAEAVAIADGRIAAVGTAEALLRRYPHARRTELPGRTIVPGFVDAHHHLLLALLYAGTADCRLDSTPTLEAVRDRLHRAARTTPAGAWVVGYGYEGQSFDGRALDRAMLDEVDGDRPVLVLHRSLHEAVANSKALALAGIGRRTPNPPAGEIGRGRRGEPSGVLIETAMAPLERLARESLVAAHATELLERLPAYEATLLRRGVTWVCDPSVPAAFQELYARARACGALRLPLTLMPVAERGLLLPPWDDITGGHLLPTGSGASDFRAGPLKLIFDGGERCAMRLSCRQLLRAIAGELRAGRRRDAPATPGPDVRLRLGRDLHFHTGVAFYGSAEAAAVVRRAVEVGLGVAIHAVGNEAVSRALASIEPARAAHPDVPPPRIEHALFADPEEIARAAGSGVMVVTQPAFLDYLARRGVPTVPGIRVLALRSMVEAGVLVASSSDAPAGEADPLAALRAAVTRRAPDGRMVAPDEAVSAAAWLAMATREAARASGCLDVAGTIEPGKRADLVVLSRDPLALEPAGLDDLRVEATFLAGEPVFAEPTLRAA